MRTSIPSHRGPFAILVLVVSLMGCGGTVGGMDGASSDAVTGVHKHVLPTINRVAATEALASSALTSASTNNGIAYHGGPVLLGTVQAYYIFYGAWPGHTAAINTLTHLAEYLGSSPVFDINQTYYDSAGRHISGAVHFGGATYDNYSLGTSLNDFDIQLIVQNAISQQKLPFNANAVYFVLTSGDVDQGSGGFCSLYCGWHTSGNINGADIKYAFVGSPSRCMNSCAPQTTAISGSAAADAMASVVTHELEESVTDPDGTGWYSGNYQENGDKCAWHFGTTYKTSSGAIANMQLGGENFLIQEDWVNANGGHCALHL